MKAKFVFKNISFEREAPPHKSLRIGKYRPYKKVFKNMDGEDVEIEVVDNSFKIYDLDVKLGVYEMEDIGEAAKVYVDGEKSDMLAFHMSPAEYEFFVPKKSSIEIDGKYQSDPNPENWSKTESAYGYPLVNKEDKDKLKEMQEKYGWWHVSHMDYTRTDKDPFVAVAKMILFTY